MAHRLAPRAETDLDDIWYYVAKESGSIEIANRLIDTLTGRFFRVPLCRACPRRRFRGLAQSKALRFRHTTNLDGLGKSRESQSCARSAPAPNMAAGAGHWAIISVNRDGSAKFSEYGPRGGGKPAYPGQYTTYQLNTNISVGANGVPTQQTLAAVQAELAIDEQQPQGSISFAYYKTSDDETASLNEYISEAQLAQYKGDAPFYLVGFNDCRDYTLGGLHAAGIVTSHTANLNLFPNFLFYFLYADADEAYNTPPKKKKPKEVVTSRICPPSGCN